MTAYSGNRYSIRLRPIKNTTLVVLSKDSTAGRLAASVLGSLRIGKGTSRNAQFDAKRTMGGRPGSQFAHSHNGRRDGSAERPVMRAELHAEPANLQQDVVFSVGLPNSGSTQLYELFKCAGWPSQRYDQSNIFPGLPRSVAECMLENVAKRLPILQQCGKYRAYTNLHGLRKSGVTVDGKPGIWMDDGSISSDTRSRMFLPQYFHLEALHEQYPNAIFVLNYRTPNSWIDAIVDAPVLVLPLINEFAAQNISDINQLLGGSGTIYNRTKVVSLLYQIYHLHHQRVRTFVQQHPSHRLIEVDVDKPEAGKKLALSLALPETCSVSSEAASNVSGKKLAFIIPFRDSTDGRSQGMRRKDNLPEWLSYMREYLPNDIIHHSHVYIIEQSDKGVFNKGLLFNAGFQYIERFRYDYMILHDVDQIPVDEQDPEIYRFHPEPSKLIRKTTRRSSLDSPEADRPLMTSNVGGALMITPEIYKQANGFSNRFGGWGGEDVNMAKRLQRQFSQNGAGRTKSFHVLDGRFRELYHDRVWGLDASEQFRSNIANEKEFTSGLSDVAYRFLGVKHSASIRGWNITRILVEPVEDPPLTKVNDPSKKSLADIIFG